MHASTDGVPVKPRIVVHERTPFMSHVLSDFLGDLIYLDAIGSAHAVAEAVELVEREQPDLVLSHVGKPPDDRSLRLAELLRAIGADADLIVFGAQGNSTSPGEYMAAGATRCLLADASLEDLDRTLREVLDEREEFAAGGSVSGS